MVAPLRISRDANCGNISASSGTRPASRRSISVSAQRRADPDLVRRRRRTRAARPAGRSATISGGREPADVDLDAEIGRAGDELRVRPLGQQRQYVGQRRRPDELGPPAHPGGRRRRRRRVLRAASASSSAGSPSAYAASRIGRYPVHRHRLPLSACRSKPFGPCS